MFTINHLLNMKAFVVSGPVIIKRKEVFKPLPSWTSIERYIDIRLLISTAREGEEVNVHFIANDPWRDKTYILFLITIVMMQIK